MLVLAAASCTAPQPRVPPAASGCGAERPIAEGGERATLWIRQSAEFRSVVEGTFRSALDMLRQGLSRSGWSAEPVQAGDVSGLPPAVVMDIDDTVLDNSAAQARMLLAGTCPGGFDAAWDAWVAERAAPAVPGALDFIRAARELRDPQGRPVRVFFVTNRECGARAGSDASCPQEADTLGNLRALGLDSPALAEELMLKNEQPAWGSEKLPRRAQIARDYRIVLNIGDDLADFLPDVRGQSLVQREEARCRHRDWWGLRWFVIPNPMYGSWQRALGADLEAALAMPPPTECGVNR
jgi:acid phosphatase